MKLLVTLFLGALLWTAAILAVGDLVLWLAAISTGLLIVIAVEASVEGWLRNRPRRRHPTFEAPRGKTRVGLR